MENNKLRIIAWLIVIIGFAVCRGQFVEDLLYNVDEAEYAVAADALHVGWLQGLDLLGTTKPPGNSYLYYMLFEVFGRNMATIHWAHLLMMMILGVLTIEISILLWGIGSAIICSLLFVIAFNTFGLPQEFIALNVETPGMLFALGGLLILLAKRKSSWIYFVYGAMIGAACLFRPSIGGLIFPAYVVAKFDNRSWIKITLQMAAGFTLVWIPVLVPYALRDSLLWTWDSWIRYPSDYAGDIGVKGAIIAFLMNFRDWFSQAYISVAFMITGVILMFKSREQFVPQFVLWLLLFSFIALAVGSRFFGHYFIQFFPAVALSGVPAWYFFSQKSAGWRKLSIGVVAIGCVAALLHFPFWRYWDDGAPRPGQSTARITPDDLDLKVVEFVKENTKPDETILVWGYAPQIYYLSHRLPGTRDYICHYITGYSPGSFDPFKTRAFRERGHPRAEEMFVEDLVNRKPKYVFDLSSVFYYEASFINYPIGLYPKLSDYLVHHYILVGQITAPGTVDAIWIYRLRTTDEPFQSDSLLTPTIP